MRASGKNHSRIKEGILILITRALKKPGIIIPIVTPNLDDANHYFKEFSHHIGSQLIKNINRQLRIIELENGSRFTFPVDQDLAKENKISA